jgi:hypothetical protein
MVYFDNQKKYVCLLIGGEYSRSQLDLEIDNIFKSSGMKILFVKNNNNEFSGSGKEMMKDSSFKLEPNQILLIAPHQIGFNASIALGRLRTNYINFAKVVNEFEMAPC